MASIVYLGLGSNIGRRKDNINKAVNYILADKYIKLLRSSSFYLTSPVGPEQRSFVNSVIKIKTKLSCEELLQLAKNIEKNMGRKKNKHWGPRIIDIDILLCGNIIINSDYLKIPHIEIQNRLFVLVPLAEIAKNLIHPVFKTTIKKLLGRLMLTSQEQKVKIMKN